MSDDHKSGCPINLTLEVVGDKWSLLIIRDMMFGNKRHYRELLRSEEGISSNILADRLRMLLAQGIITKADDPTHLQKSVYSLTGQGIELLPVLAQMAVWGRKYLPVSEELAIRARTPGGGRPEDVACLHGGTARAASGSAAAPPRDLGHVAVARRP